MEWVFLKNVFPIVISLLASVGLFEVYSWVGLAIVAAGWVFVYIKFYRYRIPKRKKNIQSNFRVIRGGKKK